MSKKDSCILMPQVNGKNSKLYKDLIKEKHYSRPVTNWLYSIYLQQGVADAMDNAGYKRNAQGQHRASDVEDFLDAPGFAKDYNGVHTDFLDSNGKPIDYTDAETALKEAEVFNSKHTGAVATVNKHGSIYNIDVFEKNSNTASFKAAVTAKLKAWEIYKQVFSQAGIDIDTMPDRAKEYYLNAFQDNIYDTLHRLQTMPFSQLTGLDAEMLMAFDPNSAQVQRVVQIYGSIEKAAEEIDKINHGQPVTSYNKARLEAAVNQCKRMKGINVAALKAQIQNTVKNVKDSDYDMSVKKTLDDLNLQFGISTEEIVLKGKQIDRLSTAAAEAIVALERQINKIREQQGNNQLGQDLSDIRKSLEKELAGKRYYFGLLNFMNQATKQLTDWDNIYSAFPLHPTTMQQMAARCSSIQAFKDLKGYYYDIVEALTRDSITIDESVNPIDIQRLKDEAKALKSLFDNFSKKINDITQDAVIDLLQEITGKDRINGVALANLVGSAAVDSSVMDLFYSMGRCSNPLIASMGTIIRNAQFERDRKMREYSLRIRRANYRLYKSGSDSSFMYEDDSIHIISDIDWAMYDTARERARKQFRSQGLSEFEVKEEMEKWEEQNTEDRVVDTVTGRTERVPNRYYRKQFPPLTAEQQEYYDTMMQIKGELGSMLPYYAQKQYIAPQVRRSIKVALGDAHYNAKKIAKAILKGIANIWKVRENDTEYLQNALVDGDFYDLGKGDARNNPQRTIPIFFTKPLRDKDELLRNFSAGIGHFVSTAANYEAMNKVKDTVEFMGDFVSDQLPDSKRVEKIKLTNMVILKAIFKRKGNTLTQAIVDGFIDQHIYGQSLKDQGKGSKLLQSLIAYTSFKGLSTNLKGAVSNAIMGEAQMLIEAGAGEFYGIRDYLWAHSKVFGNGGAYGELMEVMTNNMNHKGTILKNFFDPMQEEFGTMGHEMYYKSPVMRLFSHDVSFGLYGSGEYMIHMVNMYAVLHKEKVLLNGKRVSLYDALDMSDKIDGNRTLIIKQGATDFKGNAIDMDYLEKIKRKITYVNQTTHGAMNKEDKGILHQYMLGRAVMNFRQWMVGHYSRRFRGRHYDYTLNEDREGYYTSVWKWYKDTIEPYDTEDGKEYMKIIGQTVKDIYYFFRRSESQMANMNDDQIYNIKRAQSEIVLFLCLLGTSFALGAPDDHKKEFWYRWLLYIVRRLLNEEMSSIPVTNLLTLESLAKRPMPVTNTIRQVLYPLYGLGDIGEKVKNGKHRGENKYWYYTKKYSLPFFKDIEQMEKFDTDDSIFTVIDISPSGH